MASVAFPFLISGSGIALPGRVVYSAALEQEQGLPAGYIERHTGVRSRYWAQTDDDISSLGARALQRALEDAGLAYNDLDLLICGSASFDYPIPHNSCLIQQKMGSHTRPVPGWDIDATCLGFITALDVASRLLDGSRYRHIAIVCSEICSPSLNPNDPETYGLLGDGAVAFIVSHTHNREKGVIAAHMQTWPEYAALTVVPAGGHRIPGLSQPLQQEHYFRMDGPKLLKAALRQLKPFTLELLSMAGATIHDMDRVVPHQASMKGMTGFARLMGIPIGSLEMNIQQYGNTLSASVGIALHEAIKANRISAGSRVLLIGTGAGFSIGGIVITF